MSDSETPLRKTRPWQAARPGEPTARQDAASEPLTVLTFDISCDKARRAVVESCKDHGMTRLHWSVFEGPMTKNRREQLAGVIESLITHAEGGGKFAIFVVGAREEALTVRWRSKPKRAAGAGS